MMIRKKLFLSFIITVCSLAMAYGGDEKQPTEAKLMEKFNAEVEKAISAPITEEKYSKALKAIDGIISKIETTKENTQLLENIKKQKEDIEEILAEWREIVQKKKDAYDAAKENEQSTANKTLTALTTAATGIGGMELAMGLAEKNADKNADQDMDAYISTFRCTYGNGKQVKAGPEPIELPGGNDDKIFQYRNEYFALAADLKERKTALDMKPGIESETILDKAEMGLYDDENVGVTGGAYASLYRAKMLGSEEDQKKIDEDAAASKRRVLGGAIAAGAGALVGIVGNSLINGKLSERIKNRNNKKLTDMSTEELREYISKNEGLRDRIKQAL